MVISYGISVVDRKEGPFEVQLQLIQGYRDRRVVGAPAKDSADVCDPANTSQHPVKQVNTPQ